MASRSSMSRREFLGATAVTAGGMLVPGAVGWTADPADPLSNVGSTEHFWYRLQPAGRYIDAQRSNKAFAYAKGTVFLSEDNGRTWPHQAAFPEAERITFSHILKNGNVVFATGSKLFLSTDSLKTYRPITVKAADGSDYLPHKPQNADNPGWYFHTLPGVVSWDVNGREMMVWGNYCNVLGGATPVNIYYSPDSGQTVKIAYSFGQNHQFRDDGSPGGGAAGTLLGDPKNPIICRHVHTVAYNPAENAFYACTGDHDKPEGFECHWLRGTYDAAQDRWQWKVLVSDRMNSRYKSCGINFVDGKVYWVSDANGPKPHDRGIFCCDPADIPNPQKHTMLFNPHVECGAMLVQDGVMLASHCGPASPLATGFIISLDAGKTWAQYDLSELGRRSPTRFHEKNSDGWFRVDLRSGWIQQTEVLFIKPKKQPDAAPAAPIEMVVAPVGPNNPRNSEAAIAPLKDGSLLLAWTEFYASTGADHGPARIVGRVSKDHGVTWGAKYTLVENDGGCNVMEVNFLRLLNGQLALFHCQKNSEDKDCRVMMRTSADEGKTWGPAKQLSPPGKYTGLTNGRCIRLRTGRILLETWIDGFSYCLISDDDGRTWRESQHVKPRDGCWEPACIELWDGRVLMLMRTGMGGQYKSLSADGGQTWSQPEPTPLVGTAAPVSISRMPKTGDLLAVWNRNPGAANRNPFTAAVSRDEGQTWIHVRNIEEAADDAWAYPAVTWVKNRALLTYFNYKGGLSLKLKILPVDWFYG